MKKPSKHFKDKTKNSPKSKEDYNVFKTNLPNKRTNYFCAT